MLYFDFNSVENLKESLWILQPFEGFVLSDFVVKEIAKAFIRQGLYKPTKVSETVKEKWKYEIELTDDETERVFAENPQSHKEAGFDRGWASRFDTWFKFAKELGFVYYWQNEKIQFSESGYWLLDKQKPENEQLVFANAFAKYQRQNPFRRIRNKNVPLILLINTINFLNADEEFNGAGISKKEIPLLLCWRDNNAESLYQTIKELRKEYGFTPSDEVILEICERLIENDGRVTQMDNNSILVDYPDDFIRKIRLTGLISLRGGGRFIDINKKEIDAVNFILQNYSTYEEFETERAFFDYIGSIDKKLISSLTVYKNTALTTINEIQKWSDYYTWINIKNELLNLATNRSSRDDILKVIEKPLRLEFLTALAIINKLPNVQVKPNFTSDDEGLPVSFAAGGNPDIECVENTNTILVEVTLLTGTQQHIRESQSVRRHLENYTTKGVKAFAIFISPKAFIDTCRNAEFIEYRYGLVIRILDITLFVEQLENNQTLEGVAFTASSCK
jgi:AlwI restriction endonuclease